MDLPLVTGQVLLLCGLAIAGLVFARAFGIGYALVCALCGFIFGQLLPWLPIDTGIRASNFADVIFYLLLPPLVFEAGWQLDPRMLRRWAPLICTLAILGLVVATLAGAVVLYFGIGHASGFPPIAALLCACLLAPTDPGTVINQLRSNNAPANLETVVEGESLFNDATAIVLFTVILSFALGADAGGSNSIADAALAFCTKFGGGLLLGLACGALASLLLRLARDAASQQWILLLTVFGSFYLGEHLAHVSGVMVVLACALSTRFLSNFTDEQQETSERMLDGLGLLCTALLFSLMGLAFQTDMIAERWLAIALGILAALAARTLAVYLSLFLTSLTPAANLDYRYGPLLVGGGLRGAVTIALALSLPTDLEYWWTIQSIAFGVVIFNLFVQGPGNGVLMRRTLANTN